jgi:hypothetical protein
MRLIATCTLLFNGYSIKKAIMKKTKRKGFNFFRSYYDVYNELSDKDKLAFIEALLDKQFLGINPKGLEGMAKFAWISQVNSIDSQVKGFQDKTGIILTPTEGGVIRVENTPTEQVEGKEEVEVQEQDSVSKFTPEKFLVWFNEKRTEYLEKESHSNYLSKIDKTHLEILVNRYEGKHFSKVMHNLCNDRWANESNQVIPKHFLKPENFDKYLQIEPIAIITKKQKKNRGWAC